MNFHHVLKDVESLIRGGNQAQATKILKHLNTRRIPRDLKLPFANLFRRVELLATGLRILEPVVHPSGRGQAQEASAAEVAEYAVLLQRSGAVEEALLHLRSVNFSEAPEALLYRAFCHMGIYQAQEAADAIGLYLQKQNDPYKNLVGQVNLAYALLECGNLTEAIAITSACLNVATEKTYARLRANSLEIRAQCHLHMGDFAGARRDLEQAAAGLGSGATRDRLWIEKWQALIQGLETKSLAPIHAFRARAVEARHWETVREADSFSLRVNFDQDRFEYLFFGTPFAGFRNHLVSGAGNPKIPQQYFWGDTRAATLDLSSGKMVSKPGLEFSKGNHRLLEVLLRDFYRPLSIGGLFAGLFPDEHFSIFSSPARVNQAIYRCRSFIKDNDIPLAIVEDRGDFALQRLAPFGIAIPQARQVPSAERNHLRLLESVFSPDQTFAPSDARAVLQLTGGSFNRFTAWALQSGHIVREGQGRATKYKLLKPAA